MTTTLKQSNGNLSLQNTESAIATFEAKFAKFLSSELVTASAKKFNRISFDELDLEQPSAIKLTLSGASPPAGFSVIWEGAMFVSGTNVSVKAWRQN